MNRLLSLLVCILFFVAAKGQSSYAEAIRQGDDAFKKQQYKIAINKYFAAEAFDPDKKDSVTSRVNRTFDAIDALRKEAEVALSEAKTQTEIARANALVSEAKSALEQDPTLALRLVKQAMLIHYDTIFQKVAAKIYKENSFYRTIIKHKGIDLEKVTDESEIPDAVDSSKFFLGSFTSDGQKILTAPCSEEGIIETGPGGTTITLWDSNGKRIRDIKIPVGSVISPDLTKTIYRNNVMSVLIGDTIAKFEKDISTVSCFDNSMNRDTLITCDSNFTVRLWELNGRNYKNIRDFKVKSEDVISSVTLSRNGSKALILFNDETVQLFDLNNPGSQPVHLGTDQSIIRALFYPAGDKIILVEAKETKRDKENTVVKTYDLKGNFINSYFNEGSLIVSIAFSADGTKIFTGDSKGIVRVFDKAGNKTMELKGDLYLTGNKFTELAGSVNLILSIASSPDGTKVVTSSAGLLGNMVRLWELKGTIRQKIAGIYPGFSGDGKNILTRHKDSIYVWNLFGHPLSRIKFETECYGPLPSTSGKTIIYSCGNDSSMNLYDLETKKVKKSNAIFKISSYAISPDGQTILIYSSSDKKAILTDLDFKVVKKIENNFGDVEYVAFSPAGKPIFACRDEKHGSVRLLDEQGKTLSECKGFSDYLHDKWTFSPDGKSILVITSSKNLVDFEEMDIGLLMDMKGNKIFEIPPYISINHKDSTEIPSAVTSVAFSPDGKIIAAGYDNEIVLLWNAPMLLDDFLNGDKIDPLTTEEKIQFGISEPSKASSKKQMGENKNDP